MKYLIAVLILILGVTGGFLAARYYPSVGKNSVLPLPTSTTDNMELSLRRQHPIINSFDASIQQVAIVGAKEGQIELTDTLNHHDTFGTTSAFLILDAASSTNNPTVFQDIQRIKPTQLVTAVLKLVENEYRIDRLIITPVASRSATTR